MKVSELEGAKLDYWVAKAEKLYKPKIWDFEEGKRCVYQKMSTHDIFAPSRDWSQGGPIIERERMSFGHMGGGKYEALIYASRVCAGDTMLIAAMRCYVNYKFGDEVPDE